MIYLYTGKTGSGKTYQMIKDVYPKWRRGHDVYSNTLLFFEKFGGQAGSNILDNPENFTFWEKCVNKISFIWALRVSKKDFRPLRRGHIGYYDDISELIELKDGIILMDEAQNLLDSRNWENLPIEFSNKLRQHRKHNLDLYATTQNMGTIDINMRRLVQRWSHCNDIFALLWLRNPSWLSVHRRDEKDIDELYNKVDDLVVTTKKTHLFFISKFFTRRIYDTLYDIGFKAYKIVWLQREKRRMALIMPINWTLSNARTQSLLLKYYLDQTSSKVSSKTSNYYEQDI